MFIDVPDEHTANIFTVEEKALQPARGKQECRKLLPDYTAAWYAYASLLKI
jgi:hypothetical protein